jgi:deoxyribodipyrimidine photo-lyase
VATTVVWFSSDLRISDNEALHAACRRGAVVALFVWSPAEPGSRAPGAAKRWWLGSALRDLAGALQRCGVPLVLRRSEAALPAIEEVVRTAEADAVFWNRRYDPAVAHRDEQIARSLRRLGIWVQQFPGALWHEPEELAREAGHPYRVFTPFWRVLATRAPAGPLPPPVAAAAPSHVPRSDELDALELVPQTNQATWARCWEPTETAALRCLEEFVREGLSEYAQRRDQLAVPGTSKLSPYLAHGQLTPRQIWHRVDQAAGSSPAAAAFLRQLAWREFAYHTLVHYPELPVRSLRPEFDRFPWVELEADAWSRWQQGLTGIPVVDAGMRELLATGWMHNRARMIVASWLCKNLRAHWRHGEQWFWERLVDADPANNPFGWQWVAGSGADAAPYWRVLQPVRQGTKFDPEGLYVRRWVPELADLPAEYIHQPWLAPQSVLDRAGVVLGKTYPRPMADPTATRQASIAAFTQFRTARRS